MVMKKLLAFLLLCHVASALIGFGDDAARSFTDASVPVTQNEVISKHLENNPVVSVKYHGEELKCYLVNGRSGKDYRTFLLPCNHMDEYAFEVYYSYFDTPQFEKIIRKRAESAVTIPETIEKPKPLQEALTVPEGTFQGVDTLVLPAGSPVLGYAWALLAEERFDNMKPETRQAFQRQEFSDSDMKILLSGQGLEFSALLDNSRGLVNGYITRDNSEKQSFFLCVTLEKTYESITPQMAGHAKNVLKGLGPAVYRVNTRTKQLTPVTRNEIFGLEPWSDYSTSPKTFPMCEGLTLNGVPIPFTWPAEVVKDPMTGKKAYKFAGTDLLQDASEEDRPSGNIDKDKAASTQRALLSSRNKWGLAGSGGVTLIIYLLLRHKAARLAEVEAELLDLANQGEEAPLELLDEAASLRRWRKGLQVAGIGGLAAAAFFAAQLVTAGGADNS